MSDFNFEELKKPFPEKDIEWRLQSCGEKNGKIWGMCLAYVTNRAIQNRLDEVVGPENWKNEFVKGPDGGILCGISIKCNGEWVTKWDGAENTQIEAVKGGLSGAMKRAASTGWGIGRYLYSLEEGWAEVSDKGQFSGKTKEGKWFKWNPPKLPSWALPEDNNNTKSSLLPEAAAERKRTLEADPKFIAIRDEVNGYLNEPFIESAQREKINNAIKECNVKYLESICSWCKEQMKKGA